jgi:ABC-2 type transport system permease protein
VIGLLRSEVLRARSRRLVVMVIVGASLLIVVAMIIAGAHSHRPSASEIADAQGRYQKQLAICLRGGYLGRGGQLPPGISSLEEYCNEVVRSNADDSLKWSDAADLLVHSAGFTILLGALLGASLGGADWSTGSMPTLLTWEPRRIRVLLVRALVAAALVFAMTFGLQALLVLVFRLVVALRGSTVGTPSGLVGDLASDAVRVSVMAAAFAVIAVAIATLGRSTVAALGVLVGYLILFEGVIAGFVQSTQDKMLVRAAGVVVSRQPIYDYSGPYSDTPPILLGLGEAWVVVGVYVVVLVGLALVAMRARDVN